jgi:sortase A
MVGRKRRAAAAVAGLTVAVTCAVAGVVAVRADADDVVVRHGAGTSASPVKPAPPRVTPPRGRSAAPALAAPVGPVTITIPAAHVAALRDMLYLGGPDDARGTSFEERGLAASPLGRAGGVLPGLVGNFIVTAHRTAAGAPFLDVPDLRPGDEILVRAGAHTYVYRVTGRMWVTFHDAASYARQVAPVPGFPGRVATLAMITLSTCATPEDNAAGLRQRDALGNPPHRIDVVGRLVVVR